MFYRKYFISKVSGIRIVNTSLNFLNISLLLHFNNIHAIQRNCKIYKRRIYRLLFRKKLSVIFIDRSSNYDCCIVLFITKNHKVHRFNVCTRNIIQIEYHEYIYQIPYIIIMQGTIRLSIHTCM